MTPDPRRCGMFYFSFYSEGNKEMINPASISFLELTYYVRHETKLKTKQVVIA
jgi:hypothetical protein